MTDTSPAASPDPDAGQDLLGVNLLPHQEKNSILEILHWRMHQLLSGALPGRVHII